MKIKICGITGVEDAVCCISAGADYIGFVFAPSPRRIDEIRAGEICSVLERNGLRHKIKIAGVFVNESPGVMRSHITRGLIDIAQVHGDENPETCSQFDFPYIRGIRVKNLKLAQEAERLENEVAGLSCGTVIIDSFSHGVYGGSGLQVGIDSARVAGYIVSNSGKEFFIAGGLNPDNIQGVISQLSPDGIDISGGVEISPGIKSSEKIIAIVKAAKEERV